MPHSLLLQVHVAPATLRVLHWALRTAFALLVLCAASLLTARDEQLAAQGRRLLWLALLPVGLEASLLVWQW